VCQPNTLTDWLPSTLILKSFIPRAAPGQDRSYRPDGILWDLWCCPWINHAVSLLTSLPNFRCAKTTCFWHIVAAGFRSRRMRRLRSASRRAFWHTRRPKPPAPRRPDANGNRTRFGALTGQVKTGMPDWWTICPHAERPQLRHSNIALQSRSLSCGSLAQRVLQGSP
jgi:hypothetical protein